MNTENTTFQAFGYVNDNDESLKSKDTGRVEFGLNTGFITTLEYNPNAGKDNTAGDAVDINMMVGEKELRLRIYDVTRIYDKDGEEITDTTDAEYQKKYQDQIMQATAVITHAVKSVGVTDQQLSTALATNLPDFATWAKVVTSLVPADFSSKPVDVFLEYQWEIKGDNDRTYLQMPKNMKGGRFLTPSLAPVGEWTAENEWTENTPDGEAKNKKGLRYVDKAQNVHIFERSENYMESKKAIQQIEGEETSTSSAMGTPTTPETSNAQKSSW